MSSLQTQQHGSHHRLLEIATSSPANSALPEAEARMGGPLFEQVKRSKFGSTPGRNQTPERAIWGEVFWVKRPAALRRLISAVDVVSTATSKLTSSPIVLAIYLLAKDNKPTGGRMPKVKRESALDKERAKTEKLLKKVGYTALKQAGVASKRPDLPNLKVEKREK